MNKEYICGVPFCKHSGIYGEQFYLSGAKFINSGDGRLIDNTNKFVCMIHSQFARDNILVGNDDNRGRERYILCKDIINFFERNGLDDFTNRIEPKIILM